MNHVDLSIGLGYVPYRFLVEAGLPLCEALKQVKTRVMKFDMKWVAATLLCKHRAKKNANLVVFMFVFFEGGFAVPILATLPVQYIDCTFHNASRIL